MPRARDGENLIFSLEIFGLDAVRGRLYGAQARCRPTRIAQGERKNDAHVATFFSFIQSAKESNILLSYVNSLWYYVFVDSFWEKLPRPFFALAPMEDVTDSAFRRLLAEEAKRPDIFWTEFTSADGLARAPVEGKKALLQKLAFSEGERPVVAQFFTRTPEYMTYAAHLAVELGFDGIDINMGCPDKKVEKQGCGAAMIKDPESARAVIRAARAGAPHLPISVKTRIGYTTDELDKWLPVLLSENLAAIAVHARTRKEMSAVPARWDTIARAVALRDASGAKTLIIGNGDVASLAGGKARTEETGCDGIMIGRAAIGNPWLWAERSPTTAERIAMLHKHARIACEIFGTVAAGGTRKHLTKYVLGLDQARELRVALGNSKTLEDVIAVTERIR